MRIHTYNKKHRLNSYIENSINFLMKRYKVRRKDLVITTEIFDDMEGNKYKVYLINNKKQNLGGQYSDRVLYFKLLPYINKSMMKNTKFNKNVFGESNNHS